MLIGAEGARLLREYGAGETPQAQVAPRRLPVPPLEWKSTDKVNREGGAPKSHTFGTPPDSFILIGYLTVQPLHQSFLSRYVHIMGSHG
jgi:hypothetical protein